MARDRTYSMDKPILIGLKQLAIAVVYDLDLDKFTADVSSSSIVLAMKGVQEPLRSLGIDLLEGHRALLDCFLLSTV